MHERSSQLELSSAPVSDSRTSTHLSNASRAGQNACSRSVRLLRIRRGRECKRRHRVKAQDKASPAGDRRTLSSFDADARSRPGTIVRGMDIEPPPLNANSIASMSESYRASATAEGSSTSARPRTRARAYRSRFLAETSVVAMKPCPLASKPCQISSHRRSARPMSDRRSRRRLRRLRASSN